MLRRIVCLFVLLATSMGFSNNAFGWGVEYRSSPEDNLSNGYFYCHNQQLTWEQLHNPEYILLRNCVRELEGSTVYTFWTSGPAYVMVHNFMINVAVNELAKRNLFLWDLDKEISIDDTVFDSGWEPIKYLHFGSAFADFSWIGSPDNPDKVFPSVLDGLDIYGDNYDADSHVNQNPFCPPQGYYKLRTTWRKSIPDGINAGLEYYGELNVGLFGLGWGGCYMMGMPTKNCIAALSMQEHRQESVAVDNFYHFSLNDLFGDTAIKFYGSDPIIDDIRAFKETDMSVGFYSSILYNLASKFWKPNSHVDNPSTSDFEKAGSEAEIRTGRFHANLEPSLDCFDVIDIGIPHTYFGGNPFVCKYEGGPIDDPCRDGSPTWPYWVPKSSTDETLYLEEIASTVQPKQDRAALIYLGWATHLLQDLTMPHHAANKTGVPHVDIEIWADGLLAFGDEDFSDPCFGATCEIHGDGPTIIQHSQEFINDYFGTIDDPKSREEVCANFDLADLIHHTKYESLANFSKITIMSDELKLEAAHDLIRSGIIATMKMMACVGHSQGEFTAIKLVPIISSLLM